MRWLGVRARIDAILHKMLHPLHRMRWRAGKTNYCSGDIICDTCNNVFWCRLLDKKEKKMEEKMIKFYDVEIVEVQIWQIYLRVTAKDKEEAKAKAEQGVGEVLSEKLKDVDHKEILDICEALPSK